MELHNTLMGRKLIEGDLPRAIDALEKIANALETFSKKEEAKSFLLKLLKSMKNVKMMKKL